MPKRQVSHDIVLWNKSGSVKRTQFRSLSSSHVAIQDTVNGWDETIVYIKINSPKRQKILLDTKRKPTKKHRWKFRSIDGWSVGKKENIRLWFCSKVWPPTNNTRHIGTPHYRSIQPVGIADRDVIESVDNTHQPEQGELLRCYDSVCILHLYKMTL